MQFLTRPVPFVLFSQNRSFNFFLQFAPTKGRIAFPYVKEESKPQITGTNETCNCQELGGDLHYLIFSRTSENTFYTHHKSHTTSYTRIMLQDTQKMEQIKKLNIVIPMAGAGSRFAKAGYKDPKPFIQVRDRPMIQMVVENVRVRNCKFIFVAQESHAKEYDLNNRLRKIVPDCEIILINGITDGACCTVLKARDLINNDDALLMANSDQYLEWDAQDFVDQLRDSDGVVSTFHMPEPDKKWSYAKLDEHGYVTDVQEKNPISDLATTGIYLWRKGKDFVRCAEKMISKDLRSNNEFYVAPVYNQGIAEGMKFTVHNCKKMWGTGVPDDLDYFVSKCEQPFEPLN